jgi:hypothetical protein
MVARPTAARSGRTKFGRWSIHVERQRSFRSIEPRIRWSSVAIIARRLEPTDHLAIVTVRVVETEVPLYVTVSRSVCEPIENLRVSRVRQSTVAVLVTVRTDVPSIASVHRFDAPQGALVFMPTERFPLTLAPASGESKDAVNPPVDPPVDVFLTVVDIVDEARVLPAES